MLQMIKFISIDGFMFIIVGNMKKAEALNPDCQDSDFCFATYEQFDFGQAFNSLHLVFLICKKGITEFTFLDCVSIKGTNPYEEIRIGSIL